MSKKIDVAHLKLIKVELGHLWRLQGNLKTLTDTNYKKLRKEIIDNEFRVPFFIWEDDDGKFQILDGTQRHITLTRMKDEGYSIPELPCVLIPAGSLQEAKKALLAITSSYGEMTPEGLKEFSKGIQLDAVEINNRFTFRNVEFVFDFKKVEFDTSDTEDEIEEKDQGGESKRVGFVLTVEIFNEKDANALYDELLERDFLVKIS